MHSAVNVVESDPDQIQAVQEERVNEAKEVDIVAPSHTVGNIGTVMIKLFTTHVALSTMCGPFGSHDHAHIAKF